MCFAQLVRGTEERLEAPGQRSDLARRLVRAQRERRLRVLETRGRFPCSRSSLVDLSRQRAPLLEGRAKCSLEPLLAGRGAFEIRRESIAFGAHRGSRIPEVV